MQLDVAVIEDVDEQDEPVRRPRGAAPVLRLRARRARARAQRRRREL